jgi:hypothetical protein
MRVFAFCLLLLAGAPAGADELIRFRGPDGNLGLVDHPSKLPPGAVVLERSEKRPARAQPPAAALPEAEADAAETEVRPEPLSSLSCAHYGLEPGCDPGLVASVGEWCDRGRGARASLESAEEVLAEEEEDFEDCRTAGGTLPYCSRRQLDAAEAALERAEQALQDLEDACRAAGCLPGWVRGDCDH